ncbi:hypothetical protein B0T10DRAFT_453773 [Thelonectria olida]|uniref:Uncharacterized protein n=1 Tax=Thelonectria olida TaxID=1576542 RepID=A0A9P8WFF8_9HYPO|nr:hypothetical protein B0T10DRAFT_453773 [Thelonectria olida]
MKQHQDLQSYANAPPSTESPTFQRRLTFVLIAERQRELFRTSGPQTRRTQRNHERRESYKLWLEQERERERHQKWEQQQITMTKALAKSRARISQYADKERPVATDMEPWEAYKMLERQQWDLFSSSGPQLPRRQRKREREAEYKLWLDQERERKWEQKQVKLTKHKTPTGPHAQAKSHVQFSQHAEMETSVENETPAMKTRERREAYKLLERQQWERFVSSGSQLPRRQRKRQLRSWGPQPRQRRITNTQGPSAPTMKARRIASSPIGVDNGAPNRPEPPSGSADKPTQGSPTVASFPATTRNETWSYGRRLRSGFRGWLKNRFDLQSKNKDK